MLFAGRALQGAVSGAVFTVGSAWVAELSLVCGDGAAGRRAAVAMTGGFSIGPFVSGLLGEYAPLPTTLPYLLHVALVAVGLLAVLRVPETVALVRTDERVSSGPLVDRADRVVLLTVLAPLAVCVYAFPTVVVSAVPLLVETDAPPVLLTGVLAGLTLGVGTVAAPLQRRLGAWTALVAVLLGVVGYLTTVVGAGSGSPPVLLLRRCCSAPGGGLALAAGLALTARLARPGRRGALSAVFLGCAYVGFGAPYVVAVAAEATSVDGAARRRRRAVRAARRAAARRHPPRADQRRTRDPQRLASSGMSADDPRRRVPRTDVALADPRLADATTRLGPALVKTAVLAAQERARAGEIAPEHVVDEAAAALPAGATTLRPVLNATGVVLHTNLGRAPLSAAAVAALGVAAGAVDVEFDVADGSRARRGRGTLAALRAAVPDAEDVLVVNNGAAALVLATTALAAGREVVVSRGEMVEIGDGFRLPDLIASTGARLREVGTTNRTHLRDYADAVGPDTGCVLKVHPSNFRVEGFTSSVDVAELADARRAGRRRHRQRAARARTRCCPTSRTPRPRCGPVRRS